MLATSLSSTESEAPLITLILSDHCASDTPSRVTITLPADSPWASVHDAIGSLVHYLPGTFELRRPSADGGPCWRSRLDDVHAHTRRLMDDFAGSKCRLQIHGVDGGAPTPTSASASSPVALWRHPTPPQPNADGFTGLYNQGATCYLSSVLQSLYMTPELRLALYGCGLRDGVAVSLAKLFVSLQLSRRAAVDTKQLTAAFGWDAAAGFEQHDAQELLRLLFDVLETELQPTSEASALRRIYRGELCDYVQCKKCMYQAKKLSCFDDLSLAIRAFDEERTAYTSLEAALAAFLEPEELHGDNAYFCERCEAKQPALKGIRLTALPHVICFGLKRFDFDLATLARIKLHHKVALPSTLDMAAFLESSTVAKAPKRRQRTGLQPASPPTGSNSYVEGSMEADRGEHHRYELFSLLMHRGSALAGHYFAYIKDFHSQKWCKFDDSCVTCATDAQLLDAMGVDETPSGGASAYMCMYRRIGSDFPTVVTDEAIPDDLKRLVLEPQQPDEATSVLHSGQGSSSHAEATSSSQEEMVEATGGNIHKSSSDADSEVGSSTAPQAPPSVGSKLPRSGERILRIGHGAAR
ncbi:hypothetical protein AB1Y20_000215 [Prymnesium parvum]|uniref:Ubiquitin carboxyl-terminal hydrolase n=1 Tax=Prymnesium parvum TaxID=97485 RepID=A0AB34K8Q8_PRYPA